MLNFRLSCLLVHVCSRIHVSLKTSFLVRPAPFTHFSRRSYTCSTLHAAVSEVCHPISPWTLVPWLLPPGSNIVPVAAGLCCPRNTRMAGSLVLYVLISQQAIDESGMWAASSFPL